MSADAIARFERVVLCHLNAAHNLARHLTGNTHDAEDVVQDACLRAFRHFGGFVGDEGRPWLLAIVRNGAYDLLRGTVKCEMISLDLAPTDATALVIDGGATEVEQRLDWSRIESALSGLPAEFREVIVLREIEGMSYAEIATVVGAPAGTVMSRLSRARSRLRNLLNTHDPGEAPRVLSKQ